VPLRDLPEPAVDWTAFERLVTVLNDRTPMVWNPIKRRMTKWIDMAALRHHYGKSSQANKGQEICCNIA
jgi:hypothetical protein